MCDEDGGGKREMFWVSAKATGGRKVEGGTGKNYHTTDKLGVKKNDP